MRRLVLPFIATAALVLTTSCSATPATNDAPRAATTGAECEAAFDAASARIDEIYDTHPFHGPEVDELYADGELTDEESAQIDAWAADEEQQWAAAVDPTYDACSGVEEFYAAAFNQGDRGGWSLQADGTVFDERELKAIFLTSHCSGFENRPACADFDVNDWT